MARGNQRDKAREANQKKAAAQVRLPVVVDQCSLSTVTLTFAKKKGNTMSGTEMQRAKESAADIMRQKQAAAEAKKAEAAGGKK
ncbi:hypothetical protein Golomagni_08232 [Golovinomyces magnicellulatus]|nr:hypothetical protein Golomagni_08232 [Golovinomyces magnicellulatus]